MTRYDERCTYRQPSVVNGDLAAATPDVIDDDDNDDLRINGDSSTLASSRGMLNFLHLIFIDFEEKNC